MLFATLKEQQILSSFHFVTNPELPTLHPVEETGQRAFHTKMNLPVLQITFSHHL